MATSEITRYALIYGGNGALGGGCVTHFKANNWWVANVELCKEETIEVTKLAEKNSYTY